MLADLFELDEKEVPSQISQAADQTAQIERIMLAKGNWLLSLGVQSDDAMLKEINELESKGDQISGMGFRRLNQLRTSFQNRRRLLNWTVWLISESP